MAKLTLTVEGSTIGKATVTTDINQADSDRLVAYLTAMHGTDADGNPRNLKGIVKAYWTGVVAGTQANVERFEREEAAKAAREAVQPLAVTIT